MSSLWLPDQHEVVEYLVVMLATGVALCAGVLVRPARTVLGAVLVGSIGSMLGIYLAYMDRLARLVGADPWPMFVFLGSSSVGRVLLHSRAACQS